MWWAHTRPCTGGTPRARKRISRMAARAVGWPRPVEDWVGRRLSTYAGLGTAGGRFARLLTGRLVGNGPDHEPLVDRVRPVARGGRQGDRRSRAPVPRTVQPRVRTPAGDDVSRARVEQLLVNPRCRGALGAVRRSAARAIGTGGARGITRERMCSPAPRRQDAHPLAPGSWKCVRRVSAA